MHTRESITEQVTQIVVDQLGVDAAKAIPTARLREDLNADSLDAVELVMEIEDQFEITVPDEDVQAIKTVQHVIDRACEMLGVTDAAPAERAEASE